MFMCVCVCVCVCVFTFSGTTGVDDNKDVEDISCG